MYLEPEGYIPISSLQIQGQCSTQLHWHTFLSYEKKLPSVGKEKEDRLRDSHVFKATSASAYKLYIIDNISANPD